jgi:hypothetical protein
MATPQQQLATLREMGLDPVSRAMRLNELYDLCVHTGFSETVAIGGKGTEEVVKFHPGTGKDVLKEMRAVWEDLEARASLTDPGKSVEIRVIPLSVDLPG